MFVGHLAVALGAKKVEPAVPLGASLAAAFGLDLIWDTQPWAPLPPSTTAVAGGALILWLLPPWGVWIERHRDDRR